jgi:hypothetical protein
MSMASNFAGGPAVRLSILLLLLLACGGILAYDMYVTMPNIEKKVNEFANLNSGALKREKKLSPEEAKKLDEMSDEEAAKLEETVDLAKVREEQKKRQESNPISKAAVHEKIGLTPVEVIKIGEYEVEHYRLSRTLPFMPGGANIYAIYLNDRYLNYADKLPSAKDLETRFNLADGTDKKANLENLPVATGPGG